MRRTSEPDWRQGGLQLPDREPCARRPLRLDSTTLEPQDVARKFLGRLIVLPAEQQASLIAEIETSFRLLVADLEAKGKIPCV